MQNVNDHIIPGGGIHLQVVATDGPGLGGAYHEYTILAPDGSTLCVIKFQKNTIKNAGVNGLTNEALLAVVIDRLRMFQNGKFACNENSQALTDAQSALHWLQARTVDRMRRGVEGEHKH